ncbi:hypothetical protein S101395_04759 [Bacillus sonorensis]|uniref:Uncharacterized protein n=1 Tax=Bacillus sonorensis TaxID=119858 RepID=A0ABM6LP90_9BACI|nr:hypothetical protein S101395_04759 [Bacillus sonorensis]TWK73950.1 hypothetical protein CHCC20335_2235 [Bacillus paralicheniformis]
MSKKTGGNPLPAAGNDSLLVLYALNPSFFIIGLVRLILNSTKSQNKIM